LERLADLCAEGFQQLHESFVRLNGSRAEQLDNPEISARSDDGKRERAVQPGLQSRRGPAETLLGTYVGEYERFMSRPRAAGQIDAARYGHFLREGEELRIRGFVFHPARHTVSCDDAVLHVAVLTRCDGLLKGLLKYTPVFGVNIAQEVFVSLRGRSRRVTESAIHLGRPSHLAGLGIERPISELCYAL